MKQAVIIGLGNFGATLATALVHEKCEVVAIDNDKERVQAVKDQVTTAIVANANNKEVLKELGVADADVVVVSLGDKIDLSIMVTLFLKELGAKRIIAKTTSDDHAKALRHVGADEIIFPEKDEALRLAKVLLDKDILEHIRLSDEYSVVEIVSPEKFNSKSLKELQLRNKFGIEVLAIRNALSGKLSIVPPADYKIQPDDSLIVLGEANNLQKLRKQFS